MGIESDIRPIWQKVNENLETIVGGAFVISFSSGIYLLGISEPAFRNDPNLMREVQKAGCLLMSPLISSGVATIVNDLMNDRIHFR